MNDVREMMMDGAVTVTQAIAFTGLQRTTLYALMERGELPYLKVGRARRIPRRALTEMLARFVVAREQ